MVERDPIERHDPGRPDREAGWLVPVACAVALLHFGRPVLEPLAVAGILTLTLAPLVRRVRALGLAQTPATIVSVGLLAACVVALGAVLASQLTEVVRELPQYRAAIGAKLDQMSVSVLSPIERWEAEVATALPDHGESATRSARRPDDAAAGAPIPVEIRKQRSGAGATLSRLFTVVWGPIGEAAVVFVLLLFMLLGRDSIRERVIRLAGEKEVARLMQALADTDEGVSRFFASLVVVNMVFAAVSSLGLALLGVPHAILWGSLIGVLRFVPYLGVPAAIAVVALFAAAVDPGWSLALWAAVMLVALDVLVANAIEPHVYGHTIGIAPFGIIVAALFWGTLWGPVGLIISTPLTLCLVVAGRHVGALAPAAILFGASPGTTLAFRLYQLALAGEVQDVLDEARAYVRRHGLARYCDDALLPALALGAADSRAGRIDSRQDEAVRALLVNLVESLRAPGKRRARPTIVEASVGAQLRKLRETRLGPWQGSLDVPARSVVLCAGLGADRDELLTELLVRTLRAAHLDARSVILGARAPDPGADKAGLVSVLLLTYPAADGLAQWREECKALRARLPHALVAAVRPPDGIDTAAAPEREVQRDVEIVLHSFSEALSFASHREDRVRPIAGDLPASAQAAR
jgi:predicted PurR-regulated permease PerM